MTNRIGVSFMKKQSLRVPVLCLICGLLLSSVAFAVSNRTITVSYLDVSTDGNNNLKGTLYYKFGNTYEDIL